MKFTREEYKEYVELYKNAIDGCRKLNDCLWDRLGKDLPEDFVTNPIFTLFDWLDRKTGIQPPDSDWNLAYDLAHGEAYPIDCFDDEGNFIKTEYTKDLDVLYDTYLNFTGALRNSDLDYELKLVKDDKYRIYHNEERNVTILAVPWSSEETVPDITDATMFEANQKLVDYMNDNDNLIVYWSKVEGTTSDYTIYCDCDYEGDWNIIDLYEYLSCQCVEEEEPDKSYKYSIVKDGVMKKF